MSRFSFTTRELFLLILAAGLALGWYVDHVNMGHKVEACEMEALDYRTQTQGLTWRLKTVDPHWRDYIERPRVTVGPRNKRP
jgi:hypothetical protein